jgi:BASS family bile acid:Na+ symporter
MAYIAKSNLALSVTVTAITTMIAPVMTPLWMKWLAGTLVPVSYFNMMVEIIKIVLVPIGAALIHDYLKHASPRGRKVIFGVATFAAVWLLRLLLGGWAVMQGSPETNLVMAIALGGFLLSAFIIGVVYHELSSRALWLDKMMPTLAIVGILYVTAMTSAAGRDNLMKVGALLFLACALHNTAGFFLGYYLSRAAGLDKNSARSVAFEVGLQNGGMASGIAGSMKMLGTLGLAAACFIPWMNISGSVLANYWKKRPAN